MVVRSCAVKPPWRASVCPVTKEKDLSSIVSSTSLKAPFGKWQDIPGTTTSTQKKVRYEPLSKYWNKKPEGVNGQEVRASMRATGYWGDDPAVAIT
jgi:hypothetical protein